MRVNSDVDDDDVDVDDDVDDAQNVSKFLQMLSTFDESLPNLTKNDLYDENSA